MAIYGLKVTTTATTAVAAAATTTTTTSTTTTTTTATNEFIERYRRLKVLYNSYEKALLVIDP